MNHENNPIYPENKEPSTEPSPKRIENQPSETPSPANGYAAQWSSNGASSAPQGTPNPAQHAGVYSVNGYSAPQYNPSRPSSYSASPGVWATGADTPAKKYASRSSLILVLILAVLLSLACGIGGVALGLSLGSNDGGHFLPTGQEIKITHYNSDYTVEIDTEGTVASVVNKVSSSVVEIFTDTVTYSQYFGQQITSGAGSGVIISEDGLIITCAHVIDGATKITVALNNGEKYEATVVGSDSETDIAMIKISANKALSYVGFGTSNNLVVGQPVIAIGNPLGSLGGTVTTGIISATNREIEIEGQIYNLLQTNAAINSGNSGGGLFDMNGHLIGIVNAKSSGSSIEGLGFAIPSSQAEEIATQLIAYGYVKGRPMIGVKLFDIQNQQDFMTWFQYSRYITGYGVYVAESLQDSVKIGDRIVAIDGTEISSSADVTRVLKEKAVGDSIEVTVSRLNGNRSEIITVTITLQEKTAET